MNKKLYLVVPFLILTLLFIPACRRTLVEEVSEAIEEPVVGEVIVETESAIEEVAEELVVEEVVEPLKGEFFESIGDYNPFRKAVDYSTVVVEICMDRIDTESGTLLLTKDEVASRYLELAGQIRDDSFGLTFLKSNNEEEEKIIKLMETWFDKMETSYEYLAKYYWGDGAIYEIKSDELQEEAGKIQDEYNKAMGEYMEGKTMDEWLETIE